MQVRWFEKFETFISLTTELAVRTRNNSKTNVEDSREMKINYIIYIKITYVYTDFYYSNIYFFMLRYYLKNV